MSYPLLQIFLYYLLSKPSVLTCSLIFRHHQTLHVPHLDKHIYYVSYIWQYVIVSCEVINWILREEYKEEQWSKNNIDEDIIPLTRGTKSIRIQNSLHENAIYLELYLDKFIKFVVFSWLMWRHNGDIDLYFGNTLYTYIYIYMELSIR